MQHSHEVRLARTERPVQVGGLAGAAGYRGADEVEGLVEAADEFGSDDVLSERPGWVDDALRQAEDEIALADVFGDLDQLTKEGHRADLRWKLSSGMRPHPDTRLRRLRANCRK